MVSKIFDILLGVKKTSQITKSTSLDAVDKIVNEINTGKINPIEAYIMLDYLTKVTETSLKTIKPNTLDYIQKEGENSAFGVQLGLVAKKNYAYKEDQEWSEINKKMSLFSDALKAREAFLKTLVNESIEAGQEPQISYTSSISIVPKALNP